MPAGGFKVFVDGQVLPAADINAYLMQGILVFDSEAARDAAIAGPDHGMFAFTTDTNQLWVYDGGEWSEYAGSAPAELSNTPTGTYSSGGAGYAYYEFTASGTATITRAGFADILVVGGGGGGGSAANNFFTRGGGGGGGGYLNASTVYLPEGALTVTVGAGGAKLTNGTSSAIGSLYVAAGGGCGSLNAGVTAARGGSGGGGAGGSFGGTGIPSNGASAMFSGHGNAGGNGTLSNPAGGGGAGGAGGAPTAGVGSASSITGSSVTRAAGGAGSSDATGAANTGNGGGGGTGSDSGVAGGSGVVIIRVRT